MNILHQHIYSSFQDKFPMKLLTAWNCTDEIHLVIGSSNISSLRAQSVLSSDAKAILITPVPQEQLPQSLQQLISSDKIRHINRNFQETDLTSLGRDEVGNVVDKVFSEDFDLKHQLYQKCRSLRIPITVADSPDLCSFTMLSTHKAGDLQIGVTTDGKGCRLAARIRREIASKLPQNIDKVVENVGTLRRAIQDSDAREVGEDEEDAIQTSINSLVREFDMTLNQAKTQRKRWLSQVVEYYPFERLASMDISHLQQAYTDLAHGNSENKQHSAKGSISLIGAGPGAVSLLTVGALSEILSADLVLADKLVPQQVLELIPRNTETFIARKFPGNAEAAQQELLAMGLKGLKEGKKVIRLKQGDPYIFGRGGEEFVFFQENGFEPTVVPGITSALAATVSSQIPATQRDVADQVLICTGTGRRGVLPSLPPHIESRTTIFLMALHRVVDLIPALINEKSWDADLPAAIVERASCPDQRVVRTTLKDVAAAIETLGSRPPGLLITGRACSVLKGLPSGERWVVEEGYAGVGTPLLEGLVGELK